MNLSHLGAISTGAVVIIGLVLIAPSFMRDRSDASKGDMLLLSFDVDERNGASSNSIWCQDLADLLDNHDYKAVVFLSGRVAEQSPQCVNAFSSNVDIGSRTYSHVDITNTEYSAALKEVRAGKESIDNTGNLKSLLFKAPYQATDDNVYSLLNRSGILADFSYESQYNVYEEGQFVRYELRTADFEVHEQEELVALILDDSPIPMMVAFNSLTSVEQIESFIKELDRAEGKLRIVNASELAGINLTLREDANS